MVGVHYLLIGHCLIKKSITFFSTAHDVKHSAHLDWEFFLMLLGLVLLVVCLVLSSIQKTQGKLMAVKFSFNVT